MRVLRAGEELAEIYTCPGDMGESVCRAAGLNCKVIDGIETYDKGAGTATSPEDTARAAKMFCGLGVDLILFAGGDGTARDILDAVGESAAVLGIPAGCKIHSGVFALNPRRAGELALRYMQGKVRRTKEAEVMDIDEEQFRRGRVQSRLYGYLKIPDDVRLVQNLKSGSRVGGQDGAEGLSAYMADIWESDVLYIIGGGSTTAHIMNRMHLPGTLLGVDLVYGGRVIGADCTEREILKAVSEYGKAKILVTVIGGQGYIFGRGNQQISAEVIRRVGRENIIVAAAEEKMLALFGKTLYADTGDEEVNRYLHGYMRVITGYGQYTVMKVSD
jgi:predicted polyphosphate/ATP-dependent NAD kinase